MLAFFQLKNPSHMSWKKLIPLSRKWSLFIGPSMFLPSLRILFILNLSLGQTHQLIATGKIREIRSVNNEIGFLTLLLHSILFFFRDPLMEVRLIFFIFLCYEKTWWESFWHILLILLYHKWPSCFLKERY